VDAHFPRKSLAQRTQRTQRTTNTVNRTEERSKKEMHYCLLPVTCYLFELLLTLLFYSFPLCALLLCVLCVLCARLLQRSLPAEAGEHRNSIRVIPVIKRPQTMEPLKNALLNFNCSVPGFHHYLKRGYKHARYLSFHSILQDHFSTRYQ
jgi:hypothetical protein